MLRLLTLCLISSLFIAAQGADDEAITQKAVEAERNGDFATAALAFQELLRKGVENGGLRTNLGIAYYQLREFSEALRQFHVALTKSPDSIPANLFSGLALLKLQRPKEALGYLETAHRAQPNASAPLLALAGTEIALNQVSRARAAYEDVTRIDANNAKAWYGLGIADRILAEHELTKAKNGQNDGGHQATMKARGMMEASERAIAQAMRLDSGSVRARMILGESFRIAERYDLAIREYKAATEQQSNAGPAWAGLAIVCSASGDDQNALAAATRALDLDPKDAATTGLVAGTYLRLGDYIKAQQYAVRALRLQPDLPSGQIVSAKIYLAHQQPQKALPHLLAAAKEDTDGGTYYLLATTLRKLGRSVDAAAAMQKYQLLNRAHLATISSSNDPEH